MASGWSRIRIFDPFGNWIEEIDVPTRRSWVLDGEGRCNFSVPVYDPATGGKNPKLTYQNFKVGNFVVIDHKPSKNVDGSFNGLLPPWVGIITLPQSWQYGSVDITAFSAERVLKYRPVNLGIYAGGTPGGIFSFVLSKCNVWGGISIQPGNIDTGGRHTPGAFSTNAYDDLVKYSKLAGFDWDITPAFGNQNQLTLLGNWYSKKGIDSGLVINNLNLQNSAPLYTEQGEFYNIVRGVNDVTDSSLRVFGLASDEASRGDHGPLVLGQVFSGVGAVGQDVIQQNTETFAKNLANNPTFIKTFAPTILDVDNAFSFCVTGNTWLIQNDTVGFYNGGIGINAAARVTAVEYSELANNCKMAVAIQ